MRTSKIYMNYERWDDYSLATLAGRTLSFLTGNPNFTTPVPDLATYGAAVNDFREKHEIASKRGSGVEITAKNNARTLLLELMKQLAFYVNTVAKGDEHILLSSGFELIPAAKAKGFPGQVSGIRMLDGRKIGEVRLMFPVVRGAWEYEYEVAQTVDENGVPLWGITFRTTNSRINYIDGLESDKRCYVRVRARNGKGIGDWSNVTSLMVR